MMGWCNMSSISATQVPQATQQVNIKLKYFFPFQMVGLVFARGICFRRVVREKRVFYEKENHL